MCALFQAATCSVRLLRADDFEAVLGLYRQSEDFLALGPVPFASREMVLTDIRRSAGCGGLYCVIVDGAGATVGVLDFMPGRPGNTAVLELLMIARNHRNRGHGRSVLHGLESYLREKYGTVQIESGVQTNNPAAIRFWKRNGFTIDSTPRAMTDGTVAFEMVKLIAADP